jgi:hypothetical protein
MAGSAQSNGEGDVRLNIAPRADSEDQDVHGAGGTKSEMVAV